jgi:DNA-binding transcriptional LysR family regulator
MSDDLRSMSWDDIRLVKAVADARGLAGAARTTGLNHSTVFRRLAQIEDRAGTALFVRHRTGYAATAAGEEMVALAERMEDGVASLSRKLAGGAFSPAGELRVTTNDTLLVGLLTPIFAGFQQQCHDIRLDIVLGNQALNLSKRDADVAIRATDSPPDTLFGRRVAHIAWALYGREQDFPAPVVQPLESLLGQRWIALGDALGNFKAARFVREHVDAERIVYKLNTVLGLTEAVETGIGIGHLPCFIADRRPGLRRLSPAVPDYGVDLWLLTHPDLKNVARVRIFMDFVAAEIARQRPLIEGERGHVAHMVAGH